MESDDVVIALTQEDAKIILEILKDDLKIYKYGVGIWEELLAANNEAEYINIHRKYMIPYTPIEKAQLSYDVSSKFMEPLQSLVDRMNAELNN